MEISSWIPGTINSSKIPDFGKILKGASELAPDQARDFMFPIWSILDSGWCRPLLLEISLIHDERSRNHFETDAPQASRPSSEFTSLIISYMDDSNDSEANSVIDSWRSAIASINKYDSPPTDKFIIDFVPHPDTYRNLFLHFSCEKYLVGQKREYVSPRDLNFPRPSHPTMKIQHFQFQAPPPNRGLCELERVADHLVKHLESRSSPLLSGKDHRSQALSSLEKLLPESYILVVPFFRQIQHSFSRDYEPVRMGGTPGGCLIALVSPGYDWFDKPCNVPGITEISCRLNWLLQQAALMEGDSRMQFDRELQARTEHILAKIPHAAERPMSSATALFNQYSNSIKSALEKSDLGFVFTKISSSIARAQRAIASIDYLIRLDPRISSTETVEAKRRELLGGTCELNSLVERLSRDFESIYRSRKIAFDCKLQGHINVRGVEDCWETALWMLIKNAGEAAGQAPVTVSLSEDDDEPNYYVISIKNFSKDDVSEERLQVMRLALQGKEVRFPPSGKADGLGVGLNTVGQIVSALKLKTNVHYDPTSHLLEITLRKIVGVL